MGLSERHRKGQATSNKPRGQPDVAVPWKGAAFPTGSKRWSQQLGRVLRRYKRMERSPLRQASIPCQLPKDDNYKYRFAPRYCSRGASIVDRNEENAGLMARLKAQAAKLP